MSHKHQDNELENSFDDDEMDQMDQFDDDDDDDDEGLQAFWAENVAPNSSIEVEVLNRLINLTSVALSGSKAETSLYVEIPVSEDETKKYTLCTLSGTCPQFRLDLCFSNTEGIVKFGVTGPGTVTLLGNQRIIFDESDLLGSDDEGEEEGEEEMELEEAPKTGKGQQGKAQAPAQQTGKQQAKGQQQPQQPAKGGKGKGNAQQQPKEETKPQEQAKPETTAQPQQQGGKKGKKGAKKDAAATTPATEQPKEEATTPQSPPAQQNGGAKKQNNATPKANGGEAKKGGATPNANNAKRGNPNTPGEQNTKKQKTTTA